MEFFGSIILGFETALTPTNILYCFVGVFLGTFIGVIPGIGAMSAIALLFPLTFYLDPTTGLIMLAGIYYGTGYGGRIASILLNVPGDAACAVTCFDGYPMAQQGRGSVALLLTAVSSFIGGSIGIIAMMFVAPLIARFALSFGPADYFSMMLFGLVATAVVSDQDIAKGLGSMFLGILLGIVGVDALTGVPRLTFGSFALYDGLSLVALAMGIFGVTEVIFSVRRTPSGSGSGKGGDNLGSMRPTKDDLSRTWKPALRGSAIGSFLGALPGTGPTIASFMSYSVEKKLSPTPERFGKGAVEGVVSPEAANNAAETSAFIPTLTLGIPGSPTMALMLGVLMIHGVAPGPGMLTNNPEIFWGLVASFWIGNIILMILNVPLIGMWVRLLMVPYRLLFPAVLAFICIGVYAVANSVFDVWVVAFFGVLGYAMRILGLQFAPFLLGFVLGPLMEQHFRRAMSLSDGDLSYFSHQPVSAVLLASVAALLLFSGWAGRSRKRRI